MGTDSPTPVVIADTSVLVNFLRIDRVMLLVHLPFTFYITDHVEDEITSVYPDQQRRLDDALRDGELHRYRVELPQEHELILVIQREKRRLGIGEASALAAAVHNGWTFAVDDKAALSLCRSSYPSITILRTVDIFVTLIKNSILTVKQADAHKQDLADNHSFRLKIDSFADLL